MKKQVRDRGPLEKDIQRDCCELLESKKLFFWRSNNIPVFGKSNDGTKRFRAMSKFTPRGIPDIMLVTQGDFVGIEVKRPDMPVREEQELFGSNLTRNGALYWVVHSVGELETRLSMLGL